MHLRLALCAIVLAGLAALPGLADGISLMKSAATSTDWKLFQRDAADAAAIPVEFEYTIAQPGLFRARVIRLATGLTLPGHDWSDHTLAVPPGSDLVLTYSIQAVPAGGNYRVEVRLERAADGTIVGSDQLDQLAVGDVFLAAGQSNMSGYSESLAGAEPPIDEVHLFHNDYTWKRASEPMDDGTNQVDLVSLDFPRHSLMLRFAKDVYAATGVPVAILPGPLGGSSLYVQWQRNDANPADRGTLYGSLLHRAQLQGYDTPPVGLLWFQGETDALEGRTTAQYRADFEELIAHYRADLKRPDLFVVCAQIATFFGSDLNTWLGVQEAQRQVALADGRVALATTVDQPLHDGIHFTTQAYKTIGSRFAQAALEHLYGQPIDSLVDLTQVVVSADGRTITASFDGELSGGAAGLFRVSGRFGAIPIRSFSLNGATVQIELRRRLRGLATLSYGWSQSAGAPWLLDAAGRPTPVFQVSLP